MNINLGGQNQQPASGGISLNRGPAQTQPVQGASQGISLSKGQKVSLTKNNPTLNEIRVGLGWDINQFVGGAFDLDAQVFMLGADNKVISDSHFIFYNQTTSPDGSVVHSGDNKTGDGTGDDEVVTVKLQQVPQNVEKILFTVTIHEGKTRGQSFGQVQNAFIRVVDATTGAESVRYDLTEDYSVETALVVGEIYRHNGEWKFTAVGAGYQDELVDFCHRYGVRLG